MRQALPPADSMSIPQLVSDVRWELSNRAKLPPGPDGLGPRALLRTRKFTTDPRALLISEYREWGPVFTMRFFHRPAVNMIGAEANHFIAVSDAHRFSWRRGNFGNLVPLIGDGILTTDGEAHDRPRKLMMPAFHRRRLDFAVDVMAEEAERMVAAWKVGEVVDVYANARETLMRIAMRALVGLDPDDHGTGHELAVQFERGLSLYGRDVPMRLVRGPRTPYNHTVDAARRIDRILYPAIEQRRHAVARGEEGEDILSTLVAAVDEDGDGMSDREIRDQMVTLLFAGHDTSSSSIAFLPRELAEHPEEREAVEAELADVLGGDPPTAAALLEETPRLGMVVDETLRKYPPVWIGGRRVVEGFEFAGVAVPAGAFTFHYPWVTHHLPELWPDPERFDPERFLPERRREIPRGAYIPFGGGSRVCIGKRFGQLAVKALAVTILQRVRLETLPGHQQRFHLHPMLSPRGGQPMVVRAAQ